MVTIHHLEYSEFTLLNIVLLLDKFAYSLWCTSDVWLLIVDHDRSTISKKWLAGQNMNNLAAILDFNMADNNS